MKTKKYVAPILAGLIFIVSICACSKSGNTPQTPPPVDPGTAKNINIAGMAFPATTTVKKGTSVTWKNTDAFAHTVTSDDGTSFSSGNVAAGASFTYVANTVGTFAYHCNIHAGMTGSLVVTD